MAKLDSANAADIVTYRYLLGVKQMRSSFNDAGDIRISDLYYWNSADVDSSKDRGEVLAWGLNNACIQNAKDWEASFIGTTQAHSNKMDVLVRVMQDPEKFVSDIAKCLTDLFSFSSTTAVSLGWKL